MFGFGKVKERTTSAESIPQSEHEEKPGKLKRHGTIQSLEVFQAWAKDSFLRDSTIDILVAEHEIDCIPAVLALRPDDISQLRLPVGQQRLLEGAVEKLKQEYELVRPPTPRTKISLDAPAYKTLLEVSEKQGLEGNESAESKDVKSYSSQEGQSSREMSHIYSSPPYGSDGKLEREGLLRNEQKAKQASNSEATKSSVPQSASPSRALVKEETKDDSSCQRWVICLVFMPLFLVICVFGLVLWVLMVPFLLCCGRDGSYGNAVTDIYEHMIMAPARAYRWAASKRGLNGNATKKKGYGGTEDPEKGGQEGNKK